MPLPHVHSNFFWIGTGIMGHSRSRGFCTCAIHFLFTMNNWLWLHFQSIHSLFFSFPKLFFSFALLLGYWQGTWKDSRYWVTKKFTFGTLAKKTAGCYVQKGINFLLPLLTALKSAHTITMSYKNGNRDKDNDTHNMMLFVKQSFSFYFPLPSIPSGNCPVSSYTGFGVNHVNNVSFITRHFSLLFVGNLASSCFTLRRCRVSSLKPFGGRKIASFLARQSTTARMKKN